MGQSCPTIVTLPLNTLVIDATNPIKLTWLGENPTDATSEGYDHVFKNEKEEDCNLEEMETRENLDVGMGRCGSWYWRDIGGGGERYGKAPPWIKLHLCAGE